jgi:RHS repeat-associated protein
MTVSDVCATTMLFSRSRFTGKERDTESGNDYFGARYYASSMGRFMSPDWDSKPQAVPYASLA